MKPGKELDGVRHSDMPPDPAPVKPDRGVNYTRTGRISKAKKGLKVHSCECGRVSHVPF